MHAAAEALGLRAGGPAPRRPRRPGAGAGEAGGRARRRHRRRRASRWPRTRSRSPSRSSTSAAAGSAASAAGSPTGSRTASTADLVEHFLLQLYGGESGRDEIPREILVPALPPDAGDRRGAARPSCGAAGVDLRVPQRGDKKTLMETVARNAGQALVLHKTKRASDLTTRNRALEEIQEALELPEAPLRIECYDISNLQGTEVVASMVVFEDGLPRKSEYRRFVIQGVDGQNDVAVHARGDHPAVPAAARRAGRERPEPSTRSGDGEQGPMLVDPDDRPAPQVRLRAGAGRRRRRAAAGRGRAAGRSTSSASTTSRSSGWPSGSRRSGCPARTTR